GKKDDGSGLAEGKMATGFQTIDGKKYYFGKKDDGSGLAEGKMATAWFQVGNDWYHASAGGEINVGTTDWGTDKYFFDKTTGKSLFSIRQSFMGDYYGYGPDFTLIKGWHETSDGKHYWFDDSGCMKPSFKLDEKYYMQTLEHGIPRNTTKLIKVGTSTSKKKPVLYSAVFASPSLTETSSNTSDLATSYLLAFDQYGAVIPTKHEGQKFIDRYNAHHTGDHSNDPNTEEIEEEENGFYKEESGKT
ncbi:hypothetical protein ACIQ48_30120, partial [Bacillus mycoides]